MAIRGVAKIHEKNKLYYKYKRLDYVRNEVRYETYQTKLRNMLKSERKLHYQNLLLKYSNDVETKSWSLIKRIMNKNKWPQVQTFKLPNGMKPQTANLLVKM